MKVRVTLDVDYGDCDLLVEEVSSMIMASLGHAIRSASLLTAGDVEAEEYHVDVSEITLRA